MLLYLLNSPLSFRTETYRFKCFGWFSAFEKELNYPPVLVIFYSFFFFFFTLLPIEQRIHPAGALQLSFHLIMSYINSLESQDGGGGYSCLPQDQSGSVREALHWLRTLQCEWVCSHRWGRWSEEDVQVVCVSQRHDELIFFFLPEVKSSPPFLYCHHCRKALLLT